MKKILLTVLTLFLGLTLYGQFPNSGNRMLLGRQTTAKYLVWMGSIGDTAAIEPSSMNEAWIMIDTATNYIYGYRQKAWRLLYANAIMPFDSITFNTAKDGTVGVGEVEYSDSYGSLIQGLKGGTVTNVIGQQIHQRVTNTTGGTLTKGTAVFLYGSQGNRITVRKALATVDSTSANTFGIVAENITDGQSGYVITEGLLTGVNTATLTEGEAVYLSPTVAGQLTSTKPQAPQHTVYIGVCVKQNTGSGELFVKIRNGQEIDELHDVVITSPTSNASLYYNAAQSVWRDTGAVVLVADTASMLTNYINVTDTTSMLSPYLKKADTVSLSNRINLKLNISDTSVFARDWEVALKLDISDTSSMLTNYINVVDTSSMLLSYLRKSQMRGTAGYIAKYATDSTLTNSIIRESGTKIGINSAAGTNYTTTIYNDDSGGAPGGTAGAMTITLASSKTNNKGINITATSGGGDNYTGVDATVSNGTISNIGMKGTATFGAVAVGGLFSASDASTNYGIQINSGMSSDTATYAIHSASNAKVYFNGNVGIRTPAPDSALTVTGGIRSTTGIIAERFTVTGSTIPTNGMYLPTTNTIAFATNSTEDMRIDASGRVGIGTISPDSTLTVTGTGNFSSNVRVGGRLGVNTATPGSRLTVVGSASLGNGAANSTGSGYHTTITSGGVKATTANNTLLALLTNDALASNPLGLFMDLSANSTATSRHARLQVGEYGTSNYRSLILQPDGGMVGIRNSSPDSALTVTGGIRTTAGVTIGGDALINGITVGRGSGNEITNTAVGGIALTLQTAGGVGNTAIGYGALNGSTNPSGNTAVGAGALYNISNGLLNTAVGHEAGRYVTSGGGNSTSSNSLYLGYDSRASASGNTNETVIGYLARGNGSNTTTIGNTSTTSTFIPAGNLTIASTTADSTLRVVGTGNFTSNVRVGANLGVGTATPSYRIQATRATEVGLYLNASGGGNIAPPTTYAPGAGGLLYAFGSQAGDNFRRFLDIVADGSAGSAGSVIRFFTGNIATAERARINQDGELLVGTSTDNGAFNLQVSGTGYFSTGLRVDYTSAFDANTVFQMPNTSTKGAKGFVWATYSDARIKDNFDTIQNAIQIINSLRPLYYNQYDSEVVDGEIVTGDTNIRTVGFVAQEVVDVIPQAVQIGNQTQLWGMDYTKIIPFLTKAIQEQQSQIEDLKKQIQEIKSQINK